MFTYLNSFPSRYILVEKNITANIILLDKKFLNRIQLAHENPLVCYTILTNLTLQAALAKVIMIREMYSDTCLVRYIHKF